MGAAQVRAHDRRRQEVNPLPNEPPMTHDHDAATAGGSAQPRPHAPRDRSDIARTLPEAPGVRARSAADDDDVSVDAFDLESDLDREDVAGDVVDVDEPGDEWAGPADRGEPRQDGDLGDDAPLAPSGTSTGDDDDTEQ
jgi:hypothetical protein